MSLSSLYSTTRRAPAIAIKKTALQANREKLGERLLDVCLRTWDLGFTGFGGSPVHFRIIHQRFVEWMGLRGGKKAPWIDEQTVCILSIDVEIY
jgi:hypothetical protein